MLLSLAVLCIVVMRWFPETLLARWLNEAFVERLLRWLMSVNRRHIISFILVAAFILVAGDLIAFLGVDWLVVSLNLSIYLDAILVTTAVTIAVAVMTTWRAARSRLAMHLQPIVRRLRRAIRCKRRPRVRKPRTFADEDGPAWGLAFAA